MDNLINFDVLKIATPLIAGVTYFSAFKNGKPTCDRFIINNFLYLLVSLMIYLTSIKYYEKENINLGDKNNGIKVFGLVLITVILVIGLYYVTNPLIKHLLWVLIILILGYLGKNVFEKYNKELIRDTIFKVTIIVLGCVAFAIAFPQFIKPSMGIVLFIGLLVAIIFKIIDEVVLDRKYHNYISYLIIFIFTGFMVYDTDRVRKVGALCKKSGKPDYLENMMDMFLNIINLFSTIAGIEE